VHPLTLISTLYGQGRGYRRLDIRRRVFANEKLSPEALARLNDEGFQHHVHRSIARFPFYAERVKAHRGSLPAPGAHVRPEELPVWTREMQREFFAQQERPADAAYARHTSGSTGVVVRYYATRESYEWRTAVMDRVYTWAHAQEGVRSVHIWGTDPTPPTGMQMIKRRVHVALQRRYYYDAFKDFGDTERAACCELINRIRPAAIVGYTSMLTDLARYVRDRKALSWKARTVVTTAEGLLAGDRELLEAEIANEVFDSYGSREVMNIGTECEKHDGLHLSTDNLVVEVVDATGMPVPAGTLGRIVVTDFHNAASPLIRYDVGDIGVMGPDEPCACGRPFPRLARVEGRTQDMIHGIRGSVSTIWASFVIRHFVWIDAFQIVQNARDHMLVRLLTKRELTPELVAPIAAQLQDKLGPVVIDFERVDTIARRPNGKFQFLISTIKPSA